MLFVIAMPECGNRECRKTLTPPLLQCSRCKGEAYCCKECQVSPPPHAQREARARAGGAAHLTLPPLFPRRHQIAAWKAGHKRECSAPGQGAAASAPGQGAAAAQIHRAALGASRGNAARALPRLTVQQDRVVKRLRELQTVNDWRGVVAIEREALALARELRDEHPRLVCAVYGALGIGLDQVGDHLRAREMHEQALAVSEKLEERNDEAAACANLGSNYHGTGDYVRAREMHNKALAICKALGVRAGVARACGNLGN